MEEERYDAGGVPHARSFKRYPLPRVTDLPLFKVDHLTTPSPFTALGTKGAGESGVGGAAAAITNAITDAIGDHNLTTIQLPLTPPRVLERVLANAGCA